MSASRALVPQPHGGALLRGGVPGHRGGPGRPPSAVRALMRGKLDEVIPKLHAEWKAGAIDGVEYANFLAKYALGPIKGVTDAELDTFARQVAEAVFRVCGREAFERVVAELAEIRRREARGG